MEDCSLAVKFLIKERNKIIVFLYRHVKKVDTLLVYNVEGKVWFPITASGGPKPTAYHSSVLMSDHMILYGKFIFVYV